MKHLRLLSVFVLVLCGVAHAQTEDVGDDGSISIDKKEAYSSLHETYSKRVADNAFDVLVHKKLGPCYDDVVLFFQTQEDFDKHLDEACKKPELASDNAVVINPDDVRRMQDAAIAYNAERDEFNLRRLGMAPDTARKGIWAALHKPNSACAGYIRQLTGDADAPQDGPVSAFIQSDQMLIMSIERAGTCERRNLN